MSRTTLWILPEDRKSANTCPSEYIEPESRLADLASRLCEGQKYLNDIEPNDIEFFSYDDRIQPMGMGTPLSNRVRCISPTINTKKGQIRNNVGEYLSVK